MFGTSDLASKTFGVGKTSGRPWSGGGRVFETEDNLGKVICGGG